MGILSRAFRPPVAATTAAPQATAGNGGPYSLDDVVRFFGGNTTRAGVQVGHDSAMRNATVYSCVRVLAEDIAKVPLILYRRLPNGGRERATDHPLYGVLHDQPNAWQTSFEWREMLQGHQELRGNAYAKITRYKGEIRELVPLHPDRMEVYQDDAWRVTYRYSGKPIPATDVLHLRGLSSDGFKGISTISMQREAVALAMVTAEHGARLFGNGARPGAVLEHPAAMSDQAAKRLKDSIEEQTTGENQGKLLLLEEGLKWTSIGLNNEDAQFLETRKFQRSEIAGIFRVPPHKIGDLEHATFTNIEHQSIEYVGDALMGRMTRWEQRLNTTLLTPAERREFFFEFLIDGLLRGDTPTRFAAYNTAIQSGWMNRNEVRIRENLNPMDGLDGFLEPMNMRGANEKPAA